MKPYIPRGSKRYTVTYSVLGEEKSQTITLTPGMSVTDEVTQYNVRLMVRQSTSFATAKAYASFKVLKVVEVTEQTHDYLGVDGLCEVQVLRPNGDTGECGEPINSPVHEPEAYLAYVRELRAELRKWVQR